MAPWSRRRGDVQTGEEWPTGWGYEDRAGLQSQFIGGYNIVDPSAIPPPGMGVQQRAGVLVTEHSLLQVDVVFTALRIISNNVVKMGDLWAYAEAMSPDNIPYRKYLSKRPDVLTDTFGGGTLGGRGGMMMQCTGRDRTVWSMGLMGEAFWYTLEREGKGKFAGLPTAVEVLHPAFMDVRTYEDGPNKGRPKYIYGSGQNKKELDPDDVIHIPFKSMPAARRALSPITYVGIAGALAMAAYEFGCAWFSQGSSPSFLLSTDQKLGVTEVERIADKFIIDHSGLPNAHRPLVLDSGLKATKIMASPDEAQYLRTLEYARSVIGSWLGVPPSLLGHALEHQPPPAAHTQEEETQRFIQHTLSGYMVPLEEAHSGLLPKGVLAAFNENALSRPDAQYLSQLIMALRQTQVATQNDLRTRYLGWAPIDGGDNPSAPLASNVAPGGSGSGSAGDGNGKPAPEPEEQKALRWLATKIASSECDALAALEELA